MKTKIKVVVTMLLLSTVLVIGLQLYWNYQTFRNYNIIFKSERNAALGKVVQNLIDNKRDEFAARYRSWMADTSKIVITAAKSKLASGYTYSIRDKIPPKLPRPPFRIGTGNVIPDSNALSTEDFIRFFVKNMLYDDLKSNRINYYTDFLGTSLGKAYREDTVNLKLLSAMYAKELEKRGVMQPFTLITNPYKFSSFTEDSPKDIGEYQTSAYKYGFGTPVSIAASFENSDFTLLKKMKWAILSSLVLTLVIVYCFVYTIRSMLSEKRLAALKDSFVNNMTHELQTPVTTISIAAEAIQDFKADSKTAGDYLGIIRHQTGKLNQLIEQILNSGRNGLPKMKFLKEPVAFSELLLHTIRQYQPQLNASGASLKTSIQPDLYVRGDAANLGNVLSNLLDNAIKYAGLPPEIGIKLFSIQNRLILEVTNDGPGIPPAYQKRIFDRFFRVPTGNVHTIKGYGLGLNYAKEIVHLHKGKLTFVSDATATTFTLTLPLIKDEYTQDLIS